MYFPEDLENTPFKWKIFSNFVAFSEYPNFTISFGIVEMISVFEGEENITKCGNNDFVCCKNNWFVLGPGGSYDSEVSIQSDHPNYCEIFAKGSCQRRQFCGNIGKINHFQTIMSHYFYDKGFNSCRLPEGILRAS